MSPRGDETMWALALLSCKPASPAARHPPRPQVFDCPSPPASPSPPSQSPGPSSSLPLPPRSSPLSFLSSFLTSGTHVPPPPPAFPGLIQEKEPGARPSSLFRAESAVTRRSGPSEREMIAVPTQLTGGTGTREGSAVNIAVLHQSRS